MIEFKGFMQATNAEYNLAVGNGTAKGYLWFVRDIDENGAPDPKTSKICFGSRKYADVNDIIDSTLSITGNDVD